MYHLLLIMEKLYALSKFRFLLTTTNALVQKRIDSIKLQ